MVLHAPELRAAGIDCAKAATAVEKLLCSDPGLKGADTAVADAFAAALAASSDAAAVRAAQRDWLKKRNACADAACLTAVHAARKAELEGMRLIRRLEPHPRGFYTGAIGQIAPGGDATFAVAIRTVECDSQTGLCRFGVGGGITYDSDARGEYEECRTKAAFLRQAAPFELLETLLLAHGRFAFLPEHCARLAGSAAFSGYAHDPAVIERALAAVRLARPTGRHRVRLLLARDGHPRTEAFPLGPRGTAPLRLGWASRPVTADDPALRHKTTRRERYDRALAEHPDCDDVLLINADGEVTESCRANLVAALDGRLVTPALACGLLPGTYRERLLARGRLVEARLRPEDLARASRLWCINSVRLWMPAVLATPDPAAASAPSTGQARFATTAP